MAARVIQDGQVAPVECCTPVAGPGVTTDQAATLAAIFKALADPHRVRIVNLLANATEPVCVCEITPHLKLSQPTTSFHLKKLVASGLLTREQRGTWAFYSIDPAAMERLKGVVTYEEASR